MITTEKRLITIVTYSPDKDVYTPEKGDAMFKEDEEFYNSLWPEPRRRFTWEEAKAKYHFKG